VSDGPLSGIVVVELASEHAALAGKLFGDLGADVVVVEPPGGHASRANGPFVDDVGGAERSLWWWYYNTSKRGVVLDLDHPDDRDRFRTLVGTADILLEGEPPGRLAAIGVDHDQLRRDRGEWIWVSVTPFGRTGSRAEEPATDLTILAGSGVVWNAGYDDHSLPPVRGGGNQAFHIASTFAVMSALVAVLQRDVSGRGQHVDVSMHAAANVTTESGTFEWNTSRATVFRQTGRHAMTYDSLPAQVQAADGRYVTTGFPPRGTRELTALLDWVDEMDDEFPERAVLELAAEQGISLDDLRDNPLAAELYGVGRGALVFIAERISADDFFLGAQRRGLAVGAVWSPEEAFSTEQMVARGFPVDIEHEDLGRTITYPGALFKMSASPLRVSRRAPHVGEHQAEVLGGDQP
jgi:crotonobetainyl-CoA:carnitine CoA-transferase CaiB-like acyl-CoA transferase